MGEIKFEREGNSRGRERVDGGAGSPSPGSGGPPVKRLRVLACAYACSPGGMAERFGGGELVLGWNLVRQLARFHDVWVLSHAKHRPSIESRVAEEPLANVQFHYIDLPRWLAPLESFQGGIQFYAYLWQVKATFVARRLHRRFQFDAFHHITYANDWMASFIGALLAMPFIRGPGGGAHRTPQGFLREYPFRGRLAERLRAAGQWVYRHDPFFIIGLRRARAILVCNHEALEGIPPKWRHKAHLFPVNGVSREDFATGAEARKPDSRFHVLSAGKLLRLKAFDLAIRAFKAFSDKIPEASFTIVGDGPELGRLKGLIQDLRLQGRVDIEGWMSRGELLTKMASCDVFLFSSLRDGGGAVVVEAMAAGRPVVCLALGGPGLHVTDDCGIKISARFPEQAIRDMATALERLYTEKELRCRLGRAARQRAEQVYSWDHLGERLCGIYEAALKTKLDRAKPESAK